MTVINEWKKELYDILEQENYASFLEALAVDIERNPQGIDADLMYNAAFAYFMLGDYERSASWVENTLQVDGGNLKARILLGRICILEERTEDALAVFEFVLEHGEGQLTQDEREDIATITSYYARKDEEHTKITYPYLSVLLGFLPPETVAAHQESRNFCLENSEKRQMQVDVQNGVEAAENQLTNILGQKIALRDKVKLLETTAGGFYTQGMTTAAEKLLAAALAIDPLDDNTLRNMALVQMELGNQEKAIRFASQMQRMDFLLLSRLK